jgi:hypothetical protein
MRSRILALAAFAALIPASASAADYDYYGLGSVVGYSNLVDTPDMIIRYVAFDPKGTATLMVTRRDGNPSDRVQIDLTMGQPREILVKSVCTDVCRASIVTLKWIGSMGSSQPDKISIEYEVKVQLARSS